jgi:hypothetical protein
VAANVERTGKRKVTRLSSIARKIEGVRHVDLDLTQWCPKCKRPEIFAEVKGRLAPDGEWDQARRHAKFYGHNAIALLVIEAEDIGVKVYASSDDKIRDVIWGEEYLIRVLSQARDMHTCW